ncbi:MAG: hypothetical protein HZC37_01225 [Burkholderiales bacterium]|nr:hypothetical protein [Burkholderiales bacterium]
MRPLAAGAVTPHPLPWWTSPVGLALGFQLPVLGLVSWAGASAEGSEVITVRAIRFLAWPQLLLALGLLLAGVLGALIGRQLRLAPGAAAERGAAGDAADRTAGEASPRSPRAEADTARAWDRAAAVAGFVALAAYVIWFRDYLLNPALMLDILRGAFVPSRTDITLTPGLTSLVNVAPIFFSIHAYNRLVARQAAPRWLNGLALALVALTLFRVYAWSERLALIEAVVPAALAAAVPMMRRPGGLLRALCRAGPYAALPVVVLFFGIAESARSWSSDTYHGKYDFWSWVLGRLATYYYTALNNGAGLLATVEWPTLKFEFIGGWLHNLPGLGRHFSDWVGPRGNVLPEFFARFADPEFNSPSGLFGIVVDIGLVPGLVYMALLGFIGGALHRAYAEGRLAGVLGYPLLFITALEIFRYPYLGEPRAFTWFLGIGLALFIARGGAARAQPARRAPGAGPAPGAADARAQVPQAGAPA